MRKFKANKRMVAAKKLIEENEGTKAPQGAQYDEEGCQYLGTLHYFVKISPEHVLRKVPAAKGEVIDLPNLASNFFKGRDKDSLLVARVTLQEMKEQTAIQEAAADESTEFKPVLRIKDFFFNPTYVVTCMEILGADEATLEFNNDKIHSLIVIHADKGKGAVAPLNRYRLENADKYENYVPLSGRISSTFYMR